MRYGERWYVGRGGTAGPTVLGQGYPAGAGPMKVTNPWLAWLPAARRPSDVCNLHPSPSASIACMDATTRHPNFALPPSVQHHITHPALSAIQPLRITIYQHSVNVSRLFTAVHQPLPAFLASLTCLQQFDRDTNDATAKPT